MEAIKFRLKETLAGVIAGETGQTGDWLTKAHPGREPAAGRLFRSIIPLRALRSDARPIDPALALAAEALTLERRSNTQGGMRNTE